MRSLMIKFLSGCIRTLPWFPLQCSGLPCCAFNGIYNGGHVVGLFNLETRVFYLRIFSWRWFLPFVLFFPGTPMIWIVDHLDWPSSFLTFLSYFLSFSISWEISLTVFYTFLFNFYYHIFNFQEHFLIWISLFLMFLFNSYLLLFHECSISYLFENID